MNIPKLSIKLFLPVLFLALASCQLKPIAELEKTPAPLPAPVSIEQGKSFYPKSIYPRPEVILDHTYFQISYNEKHKLANWVTYGLYARNLKNSVGHRKDRFITDPLLIQKQIPYLDSKAYAKSGYDRGHMAPSGDFKWDQDVNDSTFVMSNMAPQKPNLNRKAWRYLEDRVRGWACHEGELSIVVGPIIEDNLSKLPSGVSVPRRFYKAVLDETPPRKAVAFIYSQGDAQDVYKERAITVRDLEKVIGYDLFLELDPKERERIESSFDLDAWVEEDCSAAGG